MALNPRRTIAGALFLAAALATCGAAEGVTTSYWKLNSTDHFLEGEHVEGVAIESDGRLTLAPAWRPLLKELKGAAYVWSLARDSKGRLYMGVGDNGGIYRWTADGGATLLWATGPSEITCLAVDAKDNLYAGSAPGGVVFRIDARGDTTRYFETGEESIWALRVGRDGALYAGTGSEGRVYRITGPGTGSIYAETRDANVMALAEAKDGALLAGTASKGLLVRIERAGSTRVLFDSDADEVRAIAVLDDGSIAAGVNRGQAGAAEPRPARNPRGAASRYAIEVVPPDGKRCAIFLVQPDGSARALYAPPAEYLYDLIPDGPRSVLAATGDAATLFRVSVDRSFTLLGVPEERQVLALARAGKDLYAATGNGPALYVLGSEPAREGQYISEAKDLRSVASWGHARVGRSGSGEVLLATRTGLGDTPDEGWSDWSAELPVRESVAVQSPAARFLQFRLRLKGGGADPPEVFSIEFAYQERNLPPELGDPDVRGPDEPFMEGGPEYRPPQISQTFASGLKVEYSQPRSGPRPVADASTAWARGIRTVAWEALDPNGDALTFTVSIKGEDERTWRPLVTDYRERVYGFDSESFPNGAYRIRVEASDSPDNPAGGALTAERVSPVFRIDNVPPRIEAIRSEPLEAVRGGIRVSGIARDADTRITGIEYSVDGGAWKATAPEDGIFDQGEERFQFEVRDLAPGEHLVTVRASDLDRNVAVGKVVTITR